jgi:hypothetical protein
MLVVAYLLSVGIDWLIFRILKQQRLHQGKAVMPWKEHRFSAPWLYVYFAIACLVLLTVAICMPRRDSSESLQPVMWMLYVWVSLGVARVIYLLCYAIGLLPCIFKRRMWQTGTYLGVPLAALTIFTMLWGATVGRRHVERKDVTVLSKKLPKGFDGYRVVQVSDLHVDCWGSDTTFVSRVVNEINALKPDVIFFTGDIVSRTTAEIRPFVKVLSRLKASDGVYSILGNHDYGDYADWPTEQAHLANTAELVKIQGEMGWTMLNNQHTFLHHAGDSIALIGVENWGEPPFKQYGNLSKAYPTNDKKQIADEHFKILLSHNPRHWHDEVRVISDIDLTLSGHTHAMQCQFSLGGWRWSPSQYRYPEWSGLYSCITPTGTLSQLYVNIGTGEVALPARIGTAFPEITLITLRKQK